jgi:hypothetical protein
MASIWRQKSYMVVLRSVSFLPSFCIRCGEPADTGVKKTFQYRNPLFLLLTLLCLPLGFLFVGTPTDTMTLRIPMCPKHLLRMRIFTVAALLVLLGSIPLGFVIGGNAGVWTGFVGFLGGLIAFTTAANFIRPVKMTKTEATFTGLGEPYLRRLDSKS